MLVISKTWKFFSEEEPEHDRPLHVLVECTGWYDGPVMGAFVEFACKLENGKYVAIAPPDVELLETSEPSKDDESGQWFVAWRYYPEDMIDNTMKEMIIKAKEMFGA